MTYFPKRSTGLLLIIAAVSSGSALQAQQGGSDPSTITVVGEVPNDLTGLMEGPEIEGLISARSGATVQIAASNGNPMSVLISSATDIKSTGGFLGLDRERLDANSLLNGLPVTVKTVRWGNYLVASNVRFRSSDLATVNMIRSGTEQRFGEHDTAIARNAAATEALRGRVSDIDQYNIKSTTNVYFDTGKWTLSPAAENDLCSVAAQAKAIDNSLLLVVGYTDATGSEEYNQVLSERRAGRVVNFLQQKCGWAPYRMLTPAGMAEADPLADNETAGGKAQNRRVAVNVLVSKAVDGL